MFSQVGAEESESDVSIVLLQFYIKHTLEISHVGPDIRVQRINNHLPVRGAGNLNAAVNQTGGGRSSLPGVIVADVLSLGQEVGEMALVNLGLAVNAALEEGLARGVEGAVQNSEESAGVLREDPAGVVVQAAEDGDVLHLGVDESHDGSISQYQTVKQKQTEIKYKEGRRRKEDVSIYNPMRRQANRTTSHSQPRLKEVCQQLEIQKAAGPMKATSTPLKSPG